MMRVSGMILKCYLKLRNLLLFMKGKLSYSDVVCILLRLGEL